MATPSTPRWWARLLLVVGGVAAALLAGEVVVRVQSPSLPSLAPLDGVDPRVWGDVQRWTDPATDLDHCGHPDAPVRFPPRTEHHGEGLGKQLWVVGDSIVHGFGVGPTDAWPQRMAADLSSHLAAPIQLTRLGGPGLGYCGWTSSLRKHRARLTPDAVVLQVFADDLERRDLVLVDGRVAAIPRHPVLRSSWLVNRLWLAWVSRLGSARPARDADHAGLAQFRSVVGSTLDQLQADGIPTLIVLVPPAGLPRCTDAETGFSDCDWLRTDQDLLATTLDTLGHPWLDLRTAWDNTPPDTLPDEERAWTERGRLPVHPGPEGHKRLAEAVLPALTALVSPDDSPPN